MRVALIIAFIVLWFVNSWALQKVYNVADYYEYTEFIYARDIVYESMMLCLSIALFIKSTPVIRSISAFIVIVIAGDIFDKLTGVYTYVYSDIILLTLALITSVYLYGRSRILGKPQERSS